MQKLDDIIAEFEDLDYQERLELLLDFSNGFPELPERFRQQRDQGLNRVIECQTPVFLWVEKEDGSRVRIYGDVAPEAPTVKGFVSILLEAYDGATEQEVVEMPTDILKQIGLADALGMTRLRGLNAIVGRLKRMAVEAIAN